MAVSKRLRFEILRRDNHACRYCGRSAPDVRLTVDHVVPTALGGSDEPTNLVAACSDCNSGKSSVPAGAELVADVASDALRWSTAMQWAADQAVEKRDSNVEIQSAIFDCWDYAKVRFRNDETYADYLPADWALSVERWIDAGLTKADLIEASEITIHARQKKPYDAWKYTCGIAWRMLTERQEAARKHLDEQAAYNVDDDPRMARAAEYAYSIDVYELLSRVCDGV